MNKIIESKVYTLGDNIDTDQILTAEYLKINPATREGYEELGTLAMSGLPNGSQQFLEKSTKRALYSIIIGGNNFGCGSSREHAVIALAASGVKAIVAKSFARIFFRNCIVSGHLLPLTIKDDRLNKFKTGDEIKIDLENGSLLNYTSGLILSIDPFGELADIVEAGGIFQYARKNFSDKI